MKQRIKIDTSLLLLILLFTGFLCLNKHLYVANHTWDRVMDFLGMIVMMKGVLLRMSARGHKRMRSQQGRQLVTTGPYALVRNPMYLGSFMVGMGFLLIVWPWWSLPIFAVFFYLRFNKQIVEEEKYLTRLFGEEFTRYCQKTPRLIPSWRSVRGLKTKGIFNAREAFSTTERRGLWAWPLLAVGLETVQETFVFGSTDVFGVLEVFAAAILALAIALWAACQYD